MELPIKIVFKYVNFKIHKTLYSNHRKYWNYYIIICQIAAFSSINSRLLIKFAKSLNCYYLLYINTSDMKLVPLNVP